MYWGTVMEKERAGGGGGEKGSVYARWYIKPLVGIM